MTTAQAGIPTTPTTEELVDRARAALQRCGVDPHTLKADAESITASSPLTGEALFDVPASRPADVEAAIQAAHTAYLTWRSVPAPVRGGLVKRLGELLTEHKADLADLVTIEVGKIRSEALGEVQEMIDICDFAVGLSRQLDGRTMPSERPGHRLMETWHPLGVVGVISAFNFPAAVWSWNAALALVCGDTVVWKPSEKTPSVASLATARAARPRAARCRRAGEPQRARAHRRAPARAAGRQPARVRWSARPGPNGWAQPIGAAGRRPLRPRAAGARRQQRRRRHAVSADLDLAVRGIVFAAAGTAGQRCTTLRRLIVHESIVDSLVDRIAALRAACRSATPSPTHPGRAADRRAGVRRACSAARPGRGRRRRGRRGRRAGRAEATPDAFYVRPASSAMPAQTEVVRRRRSRRSSTS